MSTPIFQVDAFTNRPFAGNPAGVCLLEGPADDGWMQSLAAEMNVAETAYVYPLEDGFSLRWFTPSVEVDLCGHATLASAHVLWETGQLPQTEPARFQTRSGVLTASPGGEWIELDFPFVAAEPVDPPVGLLEALGVRAVGVYRAGPDYMVELTSESEVRGANPDLTALAKIQTRGVVVTAVAPAAAEPRSDISGPGVPFAVPAGAGAPSASERPGEPSAPGVMAAGSSRGHPAYDFVSRFFAPAVGIPEDPATGSSHCALGPFWAARLSKTQLTGYQASARGGVVRVRPEGRRVHIAGQAVTVFRGELA
jgi:predicted PhzF superfamily epimerase YddE/YHI9